MIRSVVLALTLLMMASVPIVGQGHQGPNNRPNEGPIGTLLQLRDELSLTGEQVGRLTEIEMAVDRRNRPLVEQLMGLRRQVLRLGSPERLDPEGRQLYDGYQAEMRPLLKQIGKNNHAAMEEVGSVLSESQRKQVWRVLQQRNENRGRGSNSPRIPDRRN